MIMIIVINIVVAIQSLHLHKHLSAFPSEGECSPQPFAARRGALHAANRTADPIGNILRLLHSLHITELFNLLPRAPSTRPAHLDRNDLSFFFLSTCSKRRLLPPRGRPTHETSRNRFSSREPSVVAFVICQFRHNDHRPEVDFGLWQRNFEWAAVCNHFVD